MSQSLRRQRFKEGIYILFLTALLAVLTPVILRMLSSAWFEEETIYQLVWGIGYQLGNPDVVFVFPVALYLGLIAIFSLDRMKKPQAAMLVVGTVIAAFWLFTRGTLIQPVDWVGNIGVFGAGFLFGAVLGGGRKLYTETWPHEFRRSPSFILLVLATVLIAGLAEIHLLAQSPWSAVDSGLQATQTTEILQFQFTGLIPNLTFSGLYLFIVDKFTKYDYKQSFMVLGPKRGGKTTLMTGAFHSADMMTASNAGASDNLLEYHQELINADSGFGNVDEPTEAGEYHRLSFNYEHGDLIKKNVEVAAIDHGGEVLMDLKEEIEKVTSQSLWDRRPKPFKRLIEELSVIVDSVRSNTSSSSSTRSRNLPSETDSTFRTDAHEAVARSVVEADSLVVTIPMVDYVKGNVSSENLPDYYDAADPESAKRPERTAYLAEYDKILNWFTEQSGTNVFVVTTMSDLLLTEFEEQKLNGTEASTEEEYRRFEQWITTEVLGHEVERLLDYAATNTPLALHFEMNDTPHIEGDQKEPNPVLEDGTVHFANGDRLLRLLAS